MPSGETVPTSLGTSIRRSSIDPSPGNGPWPVAPFWASATPVTVATLPAMLARTGIGAAGSPGATVNDVVAGPYRSLVTSILYCASSGGTAVNVTVHVRAAAVPVHPPTASGTPSAGASGSTSRTNDPSGLALASVTPTVATTVRSAAR